MSRHHFIVEGFESGFRLRDLDSRNGTRLNGVRVAVATLQSGDSIRAGATTLAVEFCADLCDTIGPDSATPRLHDGTIQPITQVEMPPKSHPPVGSGGDQGVGKSKIADDETQWVVDSTIFDIALAISPVVAAMGVDHVSSDSGCGERGLFAALESTCIEDLAVPEPIGVVSVPEGLEEFGLQCLPNVDTGCGYVLRQAGSRGGDLCEHLGQFYRLLLVVNRSQLDPTCASLLDYLVEQGSASAVTQTIYRIDGDNSRVPLLQLMRRASRRDAAVCLGFRYSDSDPRATIADISHLLCYPSLLFRQLIRRDTDHSQSNPPVDSLFKKVVFFLFEKDLTGDLYLFTERGFRPAGTLAK